MNALHYAASVLLSTAAPTAEPRQLALFDAAVMAPPRTRRLGPRDARNPDDEAWDEAYYSRR